MICIMLHIESTYLETLVGGGVVGEQFQEDELLLLMDELCEELSLKRDAMRGVIAEASDHFTTKIRGGAWTYANKGVGIRLLPGSRGVDRGEGILFSIRAASLCKL